MALRFANTGKYIKFLKVKEATGINNNPSVILTKNLQKGIYYGFKSNGYFKAYSFKFRLIK